MKAGDLVALFKEKFLLSVAIDSARVIVIYECQQIDEEAINQLINNISLSREDFSMITYSSIAVRAEKFEIYKTNIFCAVKEYRKTVEEFFNSLKINLKKIHTFEEGQILIMPGFKVIGLPLYNHHVIFTGMLISI